VIAELILTKVDRRMSKLCPQARGYRHYDDYELYCATRAEAESAATVLQELLAEYELELSSDKTHIEALPIAHDLPWVSGLRANNPVSRPFTGDELIRYFDHAFELAKAHPHSHVLSYAVSRLQQRIRERDWPVLEALLLQVVLAEPGTFRHVVRQFSDATEAGWEPDLDKLAHVMNMQISYHARLGHGSEVAWALWTLIRFNKAVTKAAAADLSHIPDDCIVALLALDARSRKLTPKSFDVSHWNARMLTTSLYGPHWLLAYEASVKQWLPSARSTDHVQEDKAFDWLRMRKVSFYDTNAELASPPLMRPPIIQEEEGEYDEHDAMEAEAVEYEGRSI
jgi:hypothetical protein